MPQLHFRNLPRLAIVLMLSVLGACGGGSDSDDDLELSVWRPIEITRAFLLRDSRIWTEISGLEGHAPVCTLSSGTIPAGMALDGCSIVGVPTEVGIFSPVVRIGATGSSSFVMWDATFHVMGPPVDYYQGSMRVGDANTTRDPQRGIFFWQPEAGDVVVYSVAGTLPTGLTIDAQNGRISGTPTTAGTYNFQVSAQLTNAGRTVTLTGRPLTIEVTP